MPPSTRARQAPPWDGVWIAIPAYDEERTIRALAEAALALCPRVMVIDDGSGDATAARLHGLPLTLLRHPVNQGKAASLRTAFRHALAHDARCVVTLDGDGQHDPDDSPNLLAAWHDRPECLVIGSRLHDRARFPRARYLANRFACFWISWAAGHPIADSQSGFRVYPNAVMAIAVSDRVRHRRFAFESEVLVEAARRGHLTHAVEIAARYPADARASHYRSWVDTAEIVAMVAARLIATGMHPRGLWRSIARASSAPRTSSPSGDGPRCADRRSLSTE
ncbi:MAG TPA: glycosyltransferase family 2 protein [Caldimonas sp.]